MTLYCEFLHLLSTQFQIHIETGEYIFGLFMIDHSLLFKDFTVFMLQCHILQGSMSYGRTLGLNCSARNIG